MQVQTQPVHQSWITYAVTIAIVVIVLMIRMRRMGQMRPLKLETLWVVPAVYLVVALLMFIQLPPTGTTGIATLLGLLLGAALGWQRGKMMQIHVDPDTHALNQKASPAAMFFLIALIIIRMGARSVLREGVGVSPAMLTDPSLPSRSGCSRLHVLKCTFVPSACSKRRVAEPNE